MQDEWTNVGRGGQLMKFTYSDELLEGKVFLTAQIAGEPRLFSTADLQ
jgi:hypothetical protein